MIDEGALEALLAQMADEISVPADGPERVVNALSVASKGTRRSRPRFTKPLLAAAAVAVVVLAAVPLLHGTRSENSLAVSEAKPSVAPYGSSSQSKKSTAHLPLAFGSPPSPGGATASSTVAGGPGDSAKIVKTGTLDLQVPHATLRVAVNRVTGVTVGLGGYIADSKTSYRGSNATAQITIRVPVKDFETAIARVEALAGVKVLRESEDGADVSAQYADLQAQLVAATRGRDALLVVLSRAQSVGDILAVQDRVTAAETQVEQLQGHINVLNDQATFSSLAVTLSEKAAHANTAAAHKTPPTGLAKSWSDARQGFANAIEWLIARSGGALIVLLTALVLLFGVRYLYPIVRRGLL